MVISYENVRIRQCCQLLGPARLNSNFSSDEIKLIRSIIADLRSAPRLTDTPLQYSRNNSVLNISYKAFKIACEIISVAKNPIDSQVERIKINRIINTDLQIDLTASL